MIMRSLSILGVASMCAAALLCLPAQAEIVPPALAAKRSGVASQTTPSPLNTIFTPVAPCTVFDTTKTAKLTAGLTKSFYVAGASGFPQQGGTAGGCGVPDYATAVSLSLTAINGGNAGRLTVYRAAPRPDLRSLSYGANAPSTAGVIAQLSANGRTNVYTDRSVNVIGAVTGYFEPQLWAYVSPDGTLVDSSRDGTSAARTSTGQYTVTFDRDVTSCSATASSDLVGHILSAFTAGNLAQVRVVDDAGVADDYWFNLQIMC